MTFDQVMDEMFESTVEFIKDDGLLSDGSRIHDLSALIRVKELAHDTFGHLLREDDND